MCLHRSPVKGCMSYLPRSHANYASKQSVREWAASAQRLLANLQTQQNLFHQQTSTQGSSTKAIAKASKKSITILTYYSCFVNIWFYTCVLWLLYKGHTTYVMAFTCNLYYFTQTLSTPSATGLARLSNFVAQCGPCVKKFAHPWSTW